MTRPTSDGGSSDGGDGGAQSGKGGMSAINTTPGDAGSGGLPDGSCAAEVSSGVLVPLDMYMMLDVSGSMLQSTGSFDSSGKAITKWAAIKAALESFITSSTSEGISVGVQFFPLNHPNLPTSCTTDADCGIAAPCAFNACIVTQEVCVTQADCVGSANSNPCLPIGECPDHTGCQPIGGICAASPALANGGAGGTDSASGGSVSASGGNGGSGGSGPKCVAVTSSTCGHPAKCDAASYAAPAQPIQLLPDAAPALIAAIEAQTNLEDNIVTPTGPALSGAVSQAKAWAQAHPNHQVVTVLATDGLPKDCGSRTAPELKKIAAVGLAGTPAIKTFAIGIFTAAAATDGQSLLDAVALGGGTQSAFVVNTAEDVTTEFEAALQAIRNIKLSCEYAVPSPTAERQVVDYSAVNVEFKLDKATSTLFYVGSIDDCDPLDGGWYYDTDPAVAAPTRIEICPAACDELQAANNASVQIAVGCQTIVK